MLDLIQQALRQHGFGIQRIDGKTSLEDRSKALHQFGEDPDCTVMLASIGSAGEGWVKKQPTPSLLQKTNMLSWML